MAVVSADFPPSFGPGKSMLRFLAVMPIVSRSVYLICKNPFRIVPCSCFVVLDGFEKAPRIRCTDRKISFNLPIPSSSRLRSNLIPNSTGAFALPPIGRATAGKCLRFCLLLCVFYFHTCTSVIKLRSYREVSSRQMKLKAFVQITVNVAKVPSDISELLPDRFFRILLPTSPALGKCKIFFRASRQ